MIACGLEVRRDGRENYRASRGNLWAEGYTIFIMNVSLKYTYIKTYQTVHFKYVQFIVC